MKNVIVRFVCESKEECYAISEKLLNDKVLVKYFEWNTNAMYAFPGENVYRFLDYMFENCPNMAVRWTSPYLLTRSKKVLQRIRQFIEENHYENKYTIRDATNGSRLRLDFDDLL